MAVLTVTPAKVAPIFPQKALIFDFVAAAAITAGQAVTINTAGKVEPASAATAIRFAGIALSAAGAGQAVSVLKSGHVAGLTPAGNAGTPVYVGNTAGDIADAAGTATITAGSVIPIATAGGIEKVVYVEALW